MGKRSIKRINLWFYESTSGYEKQNRLNELILFFLTPSPKLVTHTITTIGLSSLLMTHNQLTDWTDNKQQWDWFERSEGRAASLPPTVHEEMLHKLTMDVELWGLTASIAMNNITVLYGNTTSNYKKATQRVMRISEKIIGLKIHVTGCQRQQPPWRSSVLLVEDWSLGHQYTN